MPAETVSVRVPKRTRRKTRGTTMMRRMPVRHAGIRLNDVISRLKDGTLVVATRGFTGLPGCDRNGRNR